MEPQFRTSFVPKRPVTAVEKKSTRRRPLGLLFVLTFVIFLLAIVLSASVFLYQQYLENSIDRKNQALETARATFDPALIRELTRLGARLETAEVLVGQHTALTKLFVFLENNTLSSVQFRDFQYEMLPDGKLSLFMGGRARSFASVALQSDVFGESNIIRGALFENLNVDVTGDVIFSMTASVDPELVSYQPSDTARPAVPRNEILEEDVATTTTSSSSGGVGTSTPQL